VVPDVADAVSEVARDTAGSETPLLTRLHADLDDLADVRSLIGDAIDPDPPQEITEGGVIREGFDAELDELRETEREGRAWVADLEASERERTGIDSLEVGYTQVHGYYIEVTDPNLDRVPDDYTRRQTLKNAERFYTPALKRREDEIIGAAERADALEHELFRDVREDVAAEADRITAVADALARLDALVSFATVAAHEGWTRPRMGADGIHIEAGRHPVVERTQGSFVPNDTHLGAGADSEADAADRATEADAADRATDADADGSAPAPQIAIITGPNMSGKSTYMRQVALICTLAQTGSFVPAEAATLPVLDRVFTRVGASDDIAGGQSTFMREMSELTEILHRATEESLVLLDEVGRGTSTADGLAIARATTEFIDEAVGAFTLFATHYHDLTDLADERPRVVNRHFTATREDGDVTFLHRIAEGPSSSSYGIEVARLAGVPLHVVDRSRELVDDESEPQTARLDRWTNRGSDGDNDGDGSNDGDGGNDGDNTAAGSTSADLVEHSAADGGTAPGSDPATASDPALAAVAGELRELDLARTTPLEALNRLHELQRKLEGDR
jgi:DNA mismatch repair protein MutS